MVAKNNNKPKSSMTRKKRPPRAPVHGNADHNSGFLLAIGGLIVNWSNNESVFLAMLQLLLLGGRHSAAIVWTSHRTSHNKLELVYQLCRERIADEALLSDIERAINLFKGFSRTRNYYCHATYHYDDQLRLLGVSSSYPSQDGYPLKFQNKKMDRAALNEITDASIKLAELNAGLWSLVSRLEVELGLRLEGHPLRPDESQ